MSASIDPLAFVASVLEDRGALVEHEAGRLSTVLPVELQSTLALPEAAVLALAPHDASEHACGLGSALLERLLDEVRAEVPVAIAAIDADPPRVTAARSLAARFVVRNAVTDVGVAVRGEATYAVCWLTWSAQADDRHDGLVRVVVCATDGSEPAPGWSELPDPSEPQYALSLRPVARLEPVIGVARFVGARFEPLVSRALEPIAAGVRRRHARDHARVAGYYDALLEETRSSRRRADPAAIAAKVAHLAAERDAKLSELGQRLSLRVSVEPVAILLVSVPVTEVRIRVRRRKREGEILLRLPAGASALDLVGCDACAGATAKPLVCDDSLHRICERCLPSAEGRPRCPACAR